MTDRIHSITVVLEKDIRSENAEVIINAITMIKGVLTATPHIVDPVAYMTKARVKSDLLHKIIDLFHE